MTGDRLAGFDAFVAGRGDALVALARGLSARDEDAEELLERALATAVRRWRRRSVAADPFAAVVRELVRLAGRDAARGRRGGERPVVVSGEADLDDLGDGDGAGGPGGSGGSDGADPGTGRRAPSVEEDPVAVLRTVPVEQRVVLLLRWLEGCDDDEVTAVLGIDAAAVDGRARAALDVMGLPA